MPGARLGFVHRYLPPARNDSGVTLLLLHGTGGDEKSLLPIGSALAPNAGFLSPLGKVRENGMPRFFRRDAQGLFDKRDLEMRTRELARFVEAASGAYGFRRDGIVAVGYSNGANMAVSLLLRYPDLVAAAVLFRPMIPFVPEVAPNLFGKPVFISAGRRDLFAFPEGTSRLEWLLAEYGADVHLQWGGDGHRLEPEEIPPAGHWLAAWMAERARRAA